MIENDHIIPAAHATGIRDKVIQVLNIRINPAETAKQGVERGHIELVPSRNDCCPNCHYLPPELWLNDAAARR